MLNNGFLLGIDPGSFKTGVAQVTPQGEVLKAEWVETKKLTEALNLLCSSKGLPQEALSATVPIRSRCIKCWRRFLLPCR